MPLGFLLKAVKGCDYDSDELYKSPEHAAFIKNMCLDLSENGSLPDGTEGTEGDNSGVFTPIESTEALCPMPLPEGSNYVIGYHESKETNEGYVFVFNSLSNHLVYVIDGYTSRCQQVRKTSCLAFQLLPQHFISKGRCVLQTICYYNTATGREERRKYLIFTDNTPPIKFLSVTDSIATNGFSTPFFKNDNCSECDMLGLALPTPNSCIGITEVGRAQDDNRDNLLSNKAWQFRVLFIDAWNRSTEHGIISDVYYSAVGACLQNSTSLARCLKLLFDAGCASIVKIQIEFRTWSSNDPDLSIPTDWYLHETIEKYDQTDQTLEWYERQHNPLLSYDLQTNKISYTFCADKGTTALPVEETNRNFNPIAHTASTVFSANQSIGTGNHRRGSQPLNVGLLNLVKYGVEKPTKTDSCIAKSRTITVYGHIHNQMNNVRVGNYYDPIQQIRTHNNRYVYGADVSNTNRLHDFQQEFPEGNPGGFIGFFADSNDWVYSIQCRLDLKTGEVVEYGLGDPYVGLSDHGEPFQYASVQKWVFKNIGSGRKVFRVASPLATPANYKTTSCPTNGTCPFLELENYVHREAHEIVIDECEGDQDWRREQIVLCDLTMQASFLRGGISNINVGYLYEDEINKIPIENAWVDVPTYAVCAPLTDHNGFYWSCANHKGWHVDLFGTKKCQRQQFLAKSFPDTNDSNPVRSQNLYAYPGTLTYPDTDRIYVKGKIKLCGSEVGVAGMVVVLEGGGVATTDESGNYTIIAHDRGLGTAPRQSWLHYTSNGACALASCLYPCSSCFPDAPFTAPPCAGERRYVHPPDQSVLVKNASLRGPQNGGRYELALIPWYGISQPGAAQRVADHSVDIPTIGETGVFGFSKITYSLPLTGYPARLRYLTIAITRNLNYENFLTWVVEKIEYVDGTGNQNTAAPTQIKLYYSGLLEYNLQNGLATNAVWETLSEKEAPIVGDRIEFIANGDGSVINKRISALVKFDKAGAYALVNYQDDLKDLKDGLQIKLIRPRVNTTRNFFYEQCIVIPVVNGTIAPQYASGVLNYFDSYFVERQVPVPYYYIDVTTKLLTKDPARSVLKTYPFPFEHHSPSDFWGDHVANRGRVFVVNPFENEYCRSTELAISKALAYDGVLNGLHYFRDQDITSFDKQEWGSITVVLSSVGALTVICQQDNFEIPFDENTVRQGPNNTLVAIPLSGRLGRPREKEAQGSGFGCHIEDINTVSEYKGVIMFIDRSEAALVQLYGGQAKDVSVNGFKGHLKDKIKHMLYYNRSSKGYLKYFHGTFDPRRKQYLLSTFTIPDFTNPVKSTPDAGYVNRLRYKSIEANETLGYSPFEDSFKLTYSFTPEYFGTLYGHVYDNQLLSFKNGLAYMHHKSAAPLDKSFLVFYGIACDAVYEPVLNIEQNAVKRYLWTEVMCRQQQFFSDQIMTESGQRSRLLLTHWDKRENFYTADFKMDLLTYKDANIPVLSDPSKAILEGNPLSGKWIKVRYVLHPDKEGGKYFELDGVHIFIFVGQKSGITPTGERIQQNRQP